MENLFKNTAISLITLYQRTLSPDHGWFHARHQHGFCKYYPSCSEYTKQAIDKHGFYGVVLGVIRILKCNPFSKGGIDLV